MSFQNFPTNKGFYAGVFMSFNLGGKTTIPVVKHRKKNLYSVPAGTYNTLQKIDERHASVEECYDNADESEVREKIETTLVKVFGSAYSEDSKKELIANLVLSFWEKSVVTLHAALEMIEESGMIPCTLEFLHRQESNGGFNQFFFRCEEALTFKSSKGFVHVTEESELPIPGEDYLMQDTDLVPEPVSLVYLSEDTYMIHSVGSDVDVQCPEDCLKRAQLRWFETFLRVEAYKKFNQSRVL